MTYHIVEIVLLAIVVILQIINLVKKPKSAELEVQECECNCSCNTSEPDKSRYYAVCVCTKVKNGQRVYRSFTTPDYIEQNLSAKDLEILRENVLTANPEYKDCVITFFSKIKG